MTQVWALARVIKLFSLAREFTLHSVLGPLFIEIGWPFLLGGSPFYKGQKIAPLFMQSLVPRAIAIIEFGAEGDNCAVAK